MVFGCSCCSQLAYVVVSGPRVEPEVQGQGLPKTVTYGLAAVWLRLMGECFVLGGLKTSCSLLTSTAIVQESEGGQLLVLQLTCAALRIWQQCSSIVGGVWALWVIYPVLMHVD